MYIWGRCWIQIWARQGLDSSIFSILYRVIISFCGYFELSLGLTEWFNTHCLNFSWSTIAVSSHLHQWDIHLSHRLHPCWSKELFHQFRNTQQSNYETMAIFQVNFVLWNVVTFSLPVNQQEVWKPQNAETPAYLSFSKVEMQRKWGINHLYCIAATMLRLILHHT